MPRRNTISSNEENNQDNNRRHVVVIANSDTALRTSSSSLEVFSVAGADVSGLQEVLASNNLILKPLFGASEDRLLARSFAATADNLPPANLSVFYEVVVPAENAEEIAAVLRQQPNIEGAYVQPRDELPNLNDMLPAPEEAPPATPDFTLRQGYLDASPGGIDARYAWTINGGRGNNVGVIDIEGAWRFTHEDLVQNQGGSIGGTQSLDVRWRNHGTAVAGEISGDVNAIGITGIAPNANIRAISIFGAGQSSARAIADAANALQPGDIILIELHRAGPRTNFMEDPNQRGYIAIEWWPADFAAIRFAIGRGVIVVAAAGNGAENLDDPVYNVPAPGFPATWRNPFARGAADSGSILVGAGAPPPNTHGQNWGPDRSRLDFSNWGAAVDAQGWGREVTTTGYGDLQGGANEDLWYTDTFSGTSSASPIIVGALASVQGMLRAANRAPLTPAAARNLLRTTGSPQQAAPNRPVTQRIGNRPNLRQIVTTLNLKGKELIKDFKDQRKDVKDGKELIKDLKDQRKDVKDGKELIKDLKDQRKDVKEIKEVKEEKESIKDLKDQRKDIKDGKELIKDLRDVGKNPREILEGKRFDEFQRFEHQQNVFTLPAAALSVDQRLSQVEQVVSELLHFITPDLRPDLTGSALSGEADAQALNALSQQLANEAQEAKDRKDMKDVEKPSEH